MLVLVGVTVADGVRVVVEVVDVSVVSVRVVIVVGVVIGLIRAMVVSCVMRDRRVSVARAIRVSNYWCVCVLLLLVL